MSVRPMKLLVFVGIYLAIAVAVTFWAVGSLNPISVYGGDSLTAKIIVTLMAALAVVSILVLVQVLLMRAALRASTGRNPDDLRCPGCGHPLLRFAESHGAPVVCVRCRRAWHWRCFCRENPNGPGRLAQLSPCVICQNESEDSKTPDFEAL